MEGHGSMAFANGDKYVGNWRNELQHGVGIFISQKTG
jgi:hypothetical protein